MSDNDREVIIELSKSEAGKTAEVSKLADMSSGKYSVYRDRLLKKGLVKSERYGHLELTLPGFREYALERAEEM